MENVVLLIPALNPDERFVQLIKELHKNKFFNIIVVNDGSDSKQEVYFEKIQNMVTVVLKHSVNLGKGRAIKTGFNYYLSEFKEKIGIITLDCDGQHTVEDVKKLAIRLKDNPECLIMGARDFKDKEVPVKSKLGNIITRKIFGLLTGIKIKDTQTGLRAIPHKCIPELMKVYGEKYEFEMEMLMYAKEKNIEILEERISTVYINKNANSHFNPIKDSIRIYKVFFKYTLSSLLAFLVDIVSYKMFFNIFINAIYTYAIAIATILARIISASVNYQVNKKVVFKKMNKKSMVRYILLCIIQMSMSALLVTFLYNKIDSHEILLKCIVDLCIFFVNYKVQQKWIFKKD